MVAGPKGKWCSWREVVGFRLSSEGRMHRTHQGMSWKRGIEGYPFQVNSKTVGWRNRVNSGSVYQGGEDLGRGSLWPKIKFGFVHVKFEMPT